jgi:hypothetical protein
VRLLRSDSELTVFSVQQIISKGLMEYASVPCPIPAAYGGQSLADRAVAYALNQQLIKEPNSVANE